MDPEQNPPMTLNEAIKAGGKPAPPKTMQDALAQGGKPVSDPVSASAVQTPSMAPAPADTEPWYSGGNPNKPLDWFGTSPTGAVIPAEQLLRRALPSREIPGSVPIPIGGGGISVPVETLAGAGLGAGRAIEGEGGMSRIKDEKSGLFDFGDLVGVASLPKRGYNPVMSMAEKEPVKSDPIKEFHDQLLGIQNQTRQQAVDDLFNRVMKAPDPRVSKRELLGLQKKKSTRPVDPSFLFQRKSP